MSNPKEHTDADGEGGGIYINLTIPPGVEPGVDSLTFQYEGNEMEIQVPEDSVPGDIFSIKVGCIGVCFFALAPCREDAAPCDFKVPRLSILNDEKFKARLNKKKKKSGGTKRKRLNAS